MELPESVTIVGRIEFPDKKSYLELGKLCYLFKKNLQKAVKMYARGIRRDIIIKVVTKELNLGYADTIYKLARFIVEGCMFNNGEPFKIRIRKVFLASRGFSSNKGNRNIRLISTSEVLVRTPDRKWIKLYVKFGKKYLPLVKELVDLALKKKISYFARIVFRDGKAYLHISIPIQLYLKHFRLGLARGKLIAGFDINSDRINMVVIDENGCIRDVKNKHFPEVVSHGFPSNKARYLRLNAIAELLDYAHHHGVKYICFENLDVIKKKKFTKNKKANRKISKFAKREILTHAVIRALRYGFRILFVNPKGSSKEARKIHKKLGLDIHTASAYIIAIRGLKILKENESVENNEKIKLW